MRIPSLLVALLVCSSASAAITHHQATTVAQQNAGGSTLALPAFSVNPTSGRCIGVLISAYRDGAAYDVTSVTDTGSNSYSRVVASSLDEANAYARSYIYAACGITGGALTITINNAGATNNYVRAYGVEFSSSIGTMSVDKTGSDTEPFADTGITATASGANTNAAAYVLAVAGAQQNAGANTLSTASSGYTSIGVDDDGGFVQAISAAYKIVSGSETSAASWTEATSMAAMTAAIATFKEPAASGSAAAMSRFREGH